MRSSITLASVAIAGVAFSQVSAHDNTNSHMAIRRHHAKAETVNARSGIIDHEDFQKRGNFQGFATFYNIYSGDQGACGGYLSSSDHIVALNQPMYGNLDAQSSWCGKKIIISDGKKQTTATIADACPTSSETCHYGSLDMSTSLFNFFNDPSVGVFPITWWPAGSGGLGDLLGGGNNKPSKSNNNNNDDSDNSGAKAAAAAKAAAEKKKQQAQDDAAAAKASAAKKAAAAKQAAADKAAAAKKAAAEKKAAEEAAAKKKAAAKKAAAEAAAKKKAAASKAASVAHAKATHAAAVQKYNDYKKAQAVKADAERKKIEADAAAPNVKNFQKIKAGLTNVIAKAQ